MGGNSARNASSTTRAVLCFGSTVASTPVKSIRRNGNPMAISSADADTATSTGRRITRCECRYQKPERSPAASRAIASFQRRGPPALTRSPSAPSNAGSSVSDTSAAISAHIAPPTPIEYRNRCRKTISAASAHATVTALNATTRPAVRSVTASASSRPFPDASSSRKRETMNSE